MGVYSAKKFQFFPVAGKVSPPNFKDFIEKSGENLENFDKKVDFFNDLGEIL